MPDLRRATPDDVHQAFANPSEDGDCVLFAACCVGEADVAERVIRRDKQAAEWARTGEALYVAAACGQSGVIARLLSMGFEHRLLPSSGVRAYPAFQMPDFWDGEKRAVSPIESPEADEADADDRRNVAMRIDYVVDGRTRILNRAFASALHAACAFERDMAVLTLLTGGVGPDWRDVDTGQTPLHAVCACTSLRGVYDPDKVRAIARALIDCGADVHARDNAGRTPLMVACKTLKVAAVDVLIAAGADVNARDETGATPLLYAISDGSNAAEVVRALIAAGADVNARTAKGVTVLMAASRVAALDIVRALLSAGADVHARDLAARTALHYAIFDDGAAALELVRAGASVDAVDALGRRPIDRVPDAYNGKIEDLLRAFVQAGSRVDGLPLERVWWIFFITPTAEMLALLVRGGLDLGAGRPRDGLTIMHLAVVGGAHGPHQFGLSSAERVRLVIEAGGPAGTPTTSDIVNLGGHSWPAGTTPLHVAAKLDAQATKLLLAAGGNPRPYDGKGRTPFDVAVGCKAWSAVAVFIDGTFPLRDYPDGYIAWLCGADRLEGGEAGDRLREALDRGLHVNRRVVGASVGAHSSDGGTLLHVACGCLPGCSRGEVNWDAVRLLLERGANVTARSEKSITALEMLLDCRKTYGSREKVELVRNLIEAHPSIAHTRMLGACLPYNGYGGAILVRALLRARVNVNALSGRDYQRQTDGVAPLHQACDAKSAAMVRLLLDFGADPNLRSKEGHTAVHYLAAEERRLTYSPHMTGCDTMPDSEDEGAATLCASDEDLGLEPGAAEDVRKKAREVAAAIHYLLQHGADFCVRDGRGSTVLHLALRSPIALLWLAAPLVSIVNAADADGNTPLHIACLNRGANVPRIFALLLADGADVNAANSRDETALEICCRRKSIEAIRALLDAGANVNRKNRSGLTPLHVCAQLPKSDRVMTLLLDAGADFRALTRSRKTALDLAIACGWQENVAVLRQRGAVGSSEDDVAQMELLSACTQGDLSTAVRLLDKASLLAKSTGGRFMRGATPLYLAMNSERDDRSEAELSGAVARGTVLGSGGAGSSGGAADHGDGRGSASVEIEEQQWRNEAAVVGYRVLLDRAAHMAAGAFV